MHQALDKKPSPGRAWETCALEMHKDGAGLGMGHTVPPGTQTCAYEDSSAGTLLSPSPNTQTSVLGEHLVRRERERAASSKTAPMLPTSHPLSAARSSWAITRSKEDVLTPVLVVAVRLVQQQGAWLPRVPPRSRL